MGTRDNKDVKEGGDIREERTRLQRPSEAGHAYENTESSQSTSVKPSDLVAVRKRVKGVQRGFTRGMSGRHVQGRSHHHPRGKRQLKPRGDATAHLVKQLKT